MAEGSFADATLRVFRGDKEGGAPVDYRVPLVPGMVVLDALHSVQAHQAPDLAVRWNCKAGKCGSCSAEVNGRPRLTKPRHRRREPVHRHVVLLVQAWPPRLSQLELPRVPVACIGEIARIKVTLGQVEQRPDIVGVAFNLVGQQTSVASVRLRVQAGIPARQKRIADARGVSWARVTQQVA